jgi:UDP-N-acetylmuramoylalanine--D-glutamate ligase
LDVHADFDEYIAAKSNIRKYQTAKDICFYHPTNEFSHRIAMASEHPNAHPYNDATDEESVYVMGSSFIQHDGCVICPVDALQLPGAHNLDNACAAICAATSGFGVSRDAVERGLRAFHGLDHRLKFIRDINGVKYYDDSIATTPGSVIAAMNAFNQPKILIMGGSSKGADFTSVAKTAATHNVKSIVVIGAEAANIEAAFKKDSAVPVLNLGSDVTMEQVVVATKEQAEPGDVVILSPACASFGMFKNYKDRGDQFIAAVDNL